MTSQFKKRRLAMVGSIQRVDEILAARLHLHRGDRVEAFLPDVGQRQRRREAQRGDAHTPSTAGARRVDEDGRSLTLMRLTTSHNAPSKSG